MADFEIIIKKHVGEDGNISSDSISELTKDISSAVGKEFVEKKRYNEKLQEIDTLKGEKQTAEDNATTAEKWKEKYEKMKSDFDDYKSKQSEKEAKAEKQSAARSYYQSQGITGKALEIAMRGSGAEIEALEIVGGKIKDTSALEDLVKGDFSDLVSSTTTIGANTATPPTNNASQVIKKSDIYKKDDKGRYVMDATERQAALATMMSNQDQNK